MTRSVAFGDRADFDWAKATATGRTMTERLPLLAPHEEENLLRKAGFLDAALFYTAFSFRGWVSTAARHERSAQTNTNAGSTPTRIATFGAVWEGYDPKLKLERSQTIMGGASHCDFK